MVDGMSVVVNGMLSLTSVMNPPHVCGKVMHFWSFCFRAELGFLNCDDICMCVGNKQFELLGFVFIPFMLTCGIMRFISRLLLGLCSHVVVLGLSVRLSW